MKRLLPVLLALGCGPAPLTVEMPLHLEDHIDAAIITGSEVPANPPQTVEWRFDQPQPDWKPTPLLNRPSATPTLARTAEGLRVTLTARTRIPDGRLRGAIHVGLPDWDRTDWADVVIRARTDSTSSVGLVRLGFNLPEGRGTGVPFQFTGQQSPIVGDGAIHTYQLRSDWYWSVGDQPWQGPWRQLGLWFGADGERGSIELLSVSVVPREVVYADSSHGVRAVTIGERIRRTLFTHAPGSMAYRVRVPQEGRLDVGLGVLTAKAPVTFAITARQGDGDVDTLLGEAYADPEQWAQRSVDLSRFAGRPVTLSLDARADQGGTVALWGAPTISGARSSSKPNVIFYVIDGAGADWMSLYGYNRRTTPFLERLAEEAVVFEHAYSNATWTKLSTPSFMTSLQYSVLGRYRTLADKIPEGVTTMAEHVGRAGYATAVITSNPFAVTMSGLERGVDEVRVINPPVNAESSQHLHRAFWDWRAAYPGEPYWVHFQTTDVHEDFRPTAPFSGLFITPELRARHIEWDSRVRYSDTASYSAAGVTVEAFALAQQALYDEGMAHQDHQLRRLVERLKASGEWENTLLVIASDHGYPAGSHRLMPGMEIGAPFLHPFATRVPLMFVWPGHIAGGRRIRKPVSMLDVLPTVLDLLALPQPTIKQGQSLALLLRGELTEEAWDQQPVIIDMFGTEFTTNELIGSIEVIDGRWGASLCVNPVSPGKAPANYAGHGDGLVDCFTRAEPLVVYDLWDDPLLTSPLNEHRPDLVEKYRTFLEQQFAAHTALRELVMSGGSAGTVQLDPEQLERLRALGYIR